MCYTRRVDAELYIHDIPVPAIARFEPRSKKPDTVCVVVPSRSGQQRAVSVGADGLVSSWSAPLCNYLIQAAQAQASSTSTDRTEVRIRRRGRGLLPKTTVLVSEAMGDQLARTKAEMFTCHMKIKLKEGVSHRYWRFNRHKGGTCNTHSR